MTKTPSNLGWKITLAGIVVLVILVAGLLIIPSFFYPFEYVRRVVFWGSSDVYDYQKFPERKLEKGDPLFRFSHGFERSKVRKGFQEAGRMDDLDSFLASNGTQAFIVIRDDRLLYEGYFKGAQRDTMFTSFSVAKSFLSALIGIAISDGYIRGVNDPITHYLPELGARDSRFSQITIRHLLMMCSGIRYAEFPFFHGDDAKTYYFPDLRRLALQETEIVHGPGKRFQYNNYHPLLLGLILERSTGQSVSIYLQEKIWKPLGMEFLGSWSLDSLSSGFEKLESGINARAIDFAKFGRLFLREGNWEGKQLIPALWVRASTSEDASLDRAIYYPKKGSFSSLSNQYYKYMWWGMVREGRNDFFARGHHGQFIYISPHKSLIIVRNGERVGVPAEKWIEMFYRFASTLKESDARGSRVVGASHASAGRPDSSSKFSSSSRVKG
jgi:CubicO group peptidase (beta-lactamase class C family)